MADNIDSMMQSLVSTLVTRATAAIAKSGGNLNPVNAIAGAAAGTVASAVTPTFPSIQTVQSYDLATNRGVLYGAGSTAAQVMQRQMQLSTAGIATSPTDAARAIYGAQSVGMGPALSNFGQVMQGAATASALTPGIGLTGGMQVMGALNNPQSVNMLRMIGINVRNNQGLPNSISSIIDQIWQQISSTYRGTGQITKAALAQSFLPGNSLWSMLNQYFGSDEYLKETIMNGLYAKASGAKNFSQSELQRVGAITPLTIAQSQRNTASLGSLQGVAGAIAGGTTAGLDIGTSMTNFATALNSAIPILSAIAGAGAVGSSAGVGFKAGGGPSQYNRPVIVGEKGPELFIPSADGTIIPNYMLSDNNSANARRGTFAFADKGMNYTRASGSDIKSWASQVLMALGAPTTAANLTALGMWAQREGGWSQNDAAFNPLNTTQPMSGSWKIKNNSAGVRGYPDLQTGIAAVVDTLTGPNAKAYGYTSIVNALRSGTNAQAVLKAINASAWVHGLKSPSNYDWTGIHPQFNAPGSGITFTANSTGGGAASGIASVLASVNGTSANDVISSLLMSGPALGANDTLFSAIQNPVNATANTNPTKKARGGAVAANARYLVGEQGPEVFVPHSSGGQQINYGGVQIHFHQVPKNFDEQKMVRLIRNALDANYVHKMAVSS